MLRYTRYAFVVCGLLLCGASTASAQLFAAGDRLFFNVNFGSQSTATLADEKLQLGFNLYDETASVDSTRPRTKGGRFVDITVGSVPIRHFGLAFNFVRRTTNAVDGALLASIPDPAYYDSPQTKSAAIPAMQHSESWMALLFVYQVPVMPKFDVTVMAGPSVVRVQHEVVSSISVDAATGRISASLDTLERDLLGVQVGVDARYMLIKQFGVGGYVRYNAAQGNLTSTSRIDAGGVQFGGGLRVRF